MWIRVRQSPSCFSITSISREWTVLWCWHRFRPQSPIMFKVFCVLSVILLLSPLVHVHGGVVVVEKPAEVKQPSPNFNNSFCSGNPKHSRCATRDHHDHPDLPDNSETIRGRADLAKEATQEYWTKMAEDIVKEHVARKENRNKAKNIIFFLGDGMGIQTGEQLVQRYWAATQYQFVSGLLRSVRESDESWGDFVFRKRVIY